MSAHLVDLTLLVKPIGLVLLAIVSPAIAGRSVPALVDPAQGMRARSASRQAASITAGATFLLALVASGDLLSPLLLSSASGRAIARSLFLLLIAVLAAGAGHFSARHAEQRSTVAHSTEPTRAALLPLRALWIALGGLVLLVAAEMAVATTRGSRSPVALLIAAAYPAITLFSVEIGPRLTIAFIAAHEASPRIRAALAAAADRLGVRSARAIAVIAGGAHDCRAVCDPTLQALIITDAASEFLTDDALAALAARAAGRLALATPLRLLRALGALAIGAVVAAALLTLLPAIQHQPIALAALAGSAITLALLGRGLRGVAQDLERRAAQRALAAGAVAGGYEEAELALARASGRALAGVAPLALRRASPAFVLLAVAVVAEIAVAQRNGAVEAARAGRYEEARSGLYLALAASPESAPTLVALGDEWLHQQALSGARCAFTAAEQSERGYAPAVLGLGLVDASEGHDPRAIGELHTVLDRTLLPAELERALFALATTLRRDGDVDGADEVGARLELMRSVRGEPTDAAPP